MDPVFIILVISVLCASAGVVLAGRGLKEKGKKLKEKGAELSPFKQRFCFAGEGIATVCFVWFVFWAHFYGSMFWKTSMLPMEDPNFPMNVLGYLASANALVGLEIFRRGGAVYLQAKAPLLVAEKKLDKSLESLLQVVESLKRFKAPTFSEPVKPSCSIALPEASDFKQ